MRPVYALALLLVVACGGTPTKPSTTPTETASVFLSFTSTPGDLLARGQTRRFEGPQATFFGGMLESNRFFTVSVRQQDGSIAASLRLAAPVGQVLTPGVYRNASRLSLPFLDFAYGGACNTNSGEFEVLEAAYGANPTGFGGYSGTIQRFRATFRQSCGVTPNDSISGEVRLSDVPLG